MKEGKLILEQNNKMRTNVRYVVFRASIYHDGVGKELLAPCFEADVQKIRK